MSHAPIAPATQRSRTTPQSAGLPDPRPVTEYSAEYAEVGGDSQISIKFDQPCIIRKPYWGFINCSDGTAIHADSFNVIGNNEILFKFNGIIPPSVAFVDVPYQDMQVQNFRGGFVRPGGQWFRQPT